MFCIYLHQHFPFQYLVGVDVFGAISRVAGPRADWYARLSGSSRTCAKAVAIAFMFIKQMTSGRLQG